MSNKSLLLLYLFIFAVSSVAQTAAEADIAKLNAEMATLYRKGDYSAALPIAKRVVELATEKYGKTDLNTARALKNRGFVENAMDDTKAAVETLDQAADIFKKYPDLSNADGLAFAQLLEALGGIRSRERSPSAQATLELAMKWREKLNGPESVEIATPAALLANVHFWNRDYKKASDLYKRAFLILAKSPPSPGDDFALVYARAECSYRKANNEDEFAPLKAAYAERNKPTATGGKVIDGGYITGKALDLRKPFYPAEARVQRVSATIDVDVLVGESGQVLSACSVQKHAHPALIEASEVAAYSSRFAPTILSGTPVKVTGRLTYNFRR
jgi:tetratricopeptide (TPR) repeat protein